jgi:hypothetical protein
MVFLALRVSDNEPWQHDTIILTGNKMILTREIKLCRSIARMVRENAMKFSDEEIGERLAAGTQEEEKGEAPLEAVCGASCACGCG